MKVRSIGNQWNESIQNLKEIEEADSSNRIEPPQQSSSESIHNSNQTTPLTQEKRKKQVVESMLEGEARRAELEQNAAVKNPRAGSSAAGSPTGPAAAVLHENMHGAQVRDLQHQLNEWRVRNRRAPISEDGSFGSDTEAAVRNFQQATGLRRDGLVGVRIRSRLGLENDPNFRNLNDATKNQVRNMMTSYQTDTSKIENLRNLATAPGFGQLSIAHQQQMLTALDHRASDPRFARELASLSNNARFRGLTDADKTQLLRNVSNHGSAAAYVRSLNNDQLLSLAETPNGPNELASLHQAIRDGGVSPSEQDQLDRIGAATFTPGIGLRVSGNAADQATYLHMTRREMLRSSGFRNLMNTQNGDEAHPLNITVGRNQHGRQIDAFNGNGNQGLDLADIERWPIDPPRGSPHAMTQGEHLVHAMAEARQGALGNGYNLSHSRAISAGNQYRADIGQTSNRSLPPNDQSTGPGNSTIFQFDNGYREELTTDPDDPTGGTITGIIRHDP